MNFLKKTLSIDGGGKMSQFKGKSYNQDKTFVHGHLYVHVKEAKNLPDMEGKP